jgi:hypothetical protein
MLSVRLWASPQIKFWIHEPIFMKFGMNIMAPGPFSTAYFINASHKYVFLYVYVPTQRLGKNITASINTRVIIEELLEASFSVRSVPCQGKEGE